ncbi:C2 family cysteine protease [Rhodopila sp.]|uniref:C2 family cysteine protease n=1 Tax=Rhodopila sp. TaxID=2480087 RepID=UPI003D1331E5
MTTGMHARHLQDDGVSGSADTDAGSLPGLSVDPIATSLAATASAAPTPRMYLTETGTAAPVSVFDINQGQLGDCFLLSPLGEAALFHPTSITGMIHDNGNGTQTVTLYTDQSGGLPVLGSVGFKAAAVTVDDSFSAASVNNGPTQDVFAQQKEIWPQVVEKAVATLNGGYAAIADGGYPVLAMEELTGHAATAIAPAALSFASLQQFVAARDLIAMDTSSTGPLPYGLVAGHCYMFDTLTGSGTAASVQLLNPWGLDQPSAIPLTQLAQGGIVQIDVGHVG